ncbi:unnamed protein product [Caenorhabditis auriculariae]|uniref:Uncharacterized protein n=1 Tax=Caenorhabditis auriculariae TaxID=2777116 RepID=A0A8S1GXH6_9PELO|nr:unnamed protein product [Caenorhabditis auriculariae]
MHRTLKSRRLARGQPPNAINNFRGETHPDYRSSLQESLTSSLRLQQALSSLVGGFSLTLVWLSASSTFSPVASGAALVPLGQFRKCCGFALQVLLKDSREPAAELRAELAFFL